MIQLNRTLTCTKLCCVECYCILISMFFCYKILVYRFADKTRNDWSARQKFVKHAGKYDMVAIDYNAQVC